MISKEILSLAGTIAFRSRFQRTANPLHQKPGRNHKGIAVSLLNRLERYSDHRYMISDTFTVIFTSVSLLIFFVPSLMESFRGRARLSDQP
jgi:hypothetical protein